MAATEHFRLFVAIEIPEAVKARMAEAQAELRGALPESGIRWARPEQFHLTLRFLGNVQAAQVEALESALCAACHDFAPLQLRAQKVGFFPGAHHPRVVWVGVRDDTGQLPGLQQAVEAAAVAFTSEEREDRFTGHVTLARIKGINRRQASALAQAAAGMTDRPLGAWEVCQVELMRSQLLPEGAHHNILASIPLGAQTR